VSDGLNPVDSNILNTDSLSGSISFTGLGSGTDFAAVVDQLVEIESIQKNRLETWRATWEAKVEVINALTQRLESVEQGAAAMDTESEFLVRTASTSDSSKTTATASSSATVGTYTVEVASASKHILQSNGVADADTTAYNTVGAAVMVINVNGTDYNINIDAAATLNTIRDNINASGAPVTASVVNDGTSSNPYHLEIKSDTGGDDYRIVVTQNPTDLNLNLSGVVLQSDWGGTTDSVLTMVGQFTGDMTAEADASVWTYTIENLTGSDQTVGGASSFDLTYTARDKSSNQISTGTITVPANYTEGDSITLENGLSIQLTAGTIQNTDSIVFRAYANDIDDAELTDWDSTAQR
jgi:flagellar hook-associated protein 2